MSYLLPHRNRVTATLLPLLLLLAGPLLAQPTWRASVDSSGEEGNGSSWSPAVSGDGRFIAFQSDASDLVPGDTNGAWDVFVHDLAQGTTTRVSVDSSGVEGNHHSIHPSISANGRFVGFASFADNLVFLDTNDRYDVFVHDRLTGTTSRVSVDTSGAQASSSSFRSSISADGRYVAFESLARLFLPGHIMPVHPQIWVRDRTSGTTTLVSRDDTGLLWGDAASTGPSISSDGRFVAFQSVATNLIGSDTNDAEDVFVRDLQTATTIRVSVDSAGIEADRDSSQASMSGNGRFVAFRSEARSLVAGDTNGVEDIFVHDTQTGATTRVSLDSTGRQGDLDSRSPAISTDGRYVAFSSRATTLVPLDGNDDWDVLVHDRLTAATSRVSLASWGEEANGGSHSPVISGDGRFVAFEGLASNLVPSDGNEDWDVFVRDRIELEAHGLPRTGSSFHFAVSNARGEAGHTAQILLSCSGTQPGFSLPAGDGRTVYLEPDLCTSLGLRFGGLLRATVAADGTASTPSFSFPAVAPGTTVYAAAVTINGTMFVSISGPIMFVAQ